MDNLKNTCVSMINDLNIILCTLEENTPDWWAGKLALASAYISTIKDFVVFCKEKHEEIESEEIESDSEDLAKTESEDITESPESLESDAEVVDEYSMLPPSFRVL